MQNIRLPAAAVLVGEIFWESSETVKRLQPSIPIFLESEEGQVIGEKSLEEAVEELLKTLTEVEEQVLRLRFGLEDEKHSRKATAAKLGISEEKVAQFQAKALRKLRHPSRSRELRAFLPPLAPDDRTPEEREHVLVFLLRKEETRAQRQETKIRYLEEELEERQQEIAILRAFSHMPEVPFPEMRRLDEMLLWRAVEELMLGAPGTRALNAVVRGSGGTTYSTIVRALEEGKISTELHNVGESSLELLQQILKRAEGILQQFMAEKRDYRAP